MLGQAVEQIGGSNFFNERQGLFMKMVTWHIRSRIIIVVVALFVIASALLVALNAGSISGNLQKYGQTVVVKDATGSAKAIDDWLTIQGNNVSLMTKTLSVMDYENTGAIQDYIASCMADNPAALIRLDNRFDLAKLLRAGNGGSSEFCYLQHLRPPSPRQRRPGYPPCAGRLHTHAFSAR